VNPAHHVVNGILEAAGVLEPGAATEVDESTRHGRGPAPAAGALEDENVGTGSGGLDGGGGARDAVSGDHNVGFVVPVRDLVGQRGIHVRVDRQGCIATGSSPVH
jgi:hypothetical protein